MQDGGPRDLRRLDGQRLHRPAGQRDPEPPDVYLGASPRGSIALYRAGQALAGLLGRDYVIPDDIKALAEPALAHRLIIKTSSSIHDVQAGQVVRELLETTPDRRHPADRRRSGATARRRPAGRARRRLTRR